MAEVTGTLARARRPDAVVTDVAGVKGPVAAQLPDQPGFVGGHPMAGSEQVGIDGADPELFVGATWVLTPTATTDPDAYARLQAVVSEPRGRGPGPVARAARHARGHGLARAAPDRGDTHEPRRPRRRGARRPAAPGRGRVPGHDAHRRRTARIWPDVCAENAPAIVAALDTLLADLSAMRDRVAAADRAGLLAELEHAAMARRSLPARAVRPERLAEVRVPVPDRPGVLAEITTLAGDLGVNIYDIELAHSVEGDRGVLVLVVDGDMAERLHDALTGRGYRSTARTSRMSPAPSRERRRRPRRRPACSPWRAAALSWAGSGPGRQVGVAPRPAPRRAGRGESVVRGLSDGDDVARTAAALRALGARVERHGAVGDRAHHRGRAGLHEPAGPARHGQLGHHHAAAGRGGGRPRLHHASSPGTPRCRPGPWTGWPSRCGCMGADGRGSGERCTAAAHHPGRRARGHRLHAHPWPAPR